MLTSLLFWITGNRELLLEVGVLHNIFAFQFLTVTLFLVIGKFFKRYSLNKDAAISVCPSKASGI